MNDVRHVSDASDRGDSVSEPVLHTVPAASPEVPVANRRNFGHALPAILSWIAIVAAFLGTILVPKTWLMIVIGFVIYFSTRMVITFVFSLRAESKRREWIKRDWTVDSDVKGPFGFAPDDLHHIVIIPNYKEPDDLLRRTLDALAKQHGAPQRVIVALGMEEREEGAEEKGRRLAEEYADRFEHVLVSMHPGGIPGEEPGKSSNENWAARRSRELLDQLGIPVELATVTSCDADSLLHPSYFAAVSQMFAHDEERYTRFWQAPIFYYNNIWDVPGPIRFNTWLSHAVQLAELAMPFYDALPISTYTLSMKLAEECDFWDPGVIPEDWHEYLNCLFSSGRDIHTAAVFLPTMADATDGESWLNAMSNRFHQVKRHAWGAEDVGYIFGQLSEKPHTRRASTVFRFFQVLHDHVLRVASWFMLVSTYALSAYYSRLHWYSLGWQSDVAHELLILRFIFSVGGVIMACNILFELYRCPPPTGAPIVWTLVELAFMWMLLPVFSFYLGTLPAIEAQSRLALGIPLGYRVTPKRLAAITTTRA